MPLTMTPRKFALSVQRRSMSSRIEFFGVLPALTTTATPFFVDGNVVDGAEAPSSDTASHAYIYRHMPDVYGVVHTHSTYATAWAATGQNIPCGLTMMGDEFGGPVPVGPFRLIGSEAIGEGVVETLKKYPKSPAVLMQNHGPFTIGKDAEAAVKAAAMTEEVAHTMWAAKQLGDIIPISQEDIDSLNDRYTNVYGQH